SMARSSRRTAHCDRQSARNNAPTASVLGGSAPLARGQCYDRPVVDASPTLRSSTDDEAPLSSRSAPVLVLDADDVARAQAIDALAGDGLAAVAFGAARDALAWLDRATPSAVVIDLVH